MWRHFLIMNTILSKYKKIQEPLGAGSYGVVYLLSVLELTISII